MRWTLPAKDGATGQTPYEALRCTCAHTSPLHTLISSGHRGACRCSTCDCKGFTEAKEST